MPTVILVLSSDATKLKMKTGDAIIWCLEELCVREAPGADVTLTLDRDHDIVERRGRERCRHSSGCFTWP